MKNEELTGLLDEQMEEFELARDNYAALGKVVYREVLCREFSCRLQYNPARIVSTNARIDRATLEGRKCFLCTEHMPAGQRGISYGERYHIFVNPYPIFDRHFTVPSNQHAPQAIANRFQDLLDLAFDFQDYTTFYNGPASGASAPDHFHFQMAPRHRMPLEEDVMNDEIRKVVCQRDYYTVSVLEHYLREVIVLQASDQKLLGRLFERLQQVIGRTIPYEQEPQFNLLAWFDNCQWTVCVFPRKQLRPRQFFAEGDERIMFSPGSVDMAGLIITPRKEDFDRLSPELLTDLFGQVTICPSDVEKIVKEIAGFNDLINA